MELTIGQVGEGGLLAAIAEQLHPPMEGLGFGDDAAAQRVAPGQLALTTLDMLVEDVHFRLGTTSAADLGHKALAVNLSDIAGMGGRPRWAVVGLGLPPDTRLSWVKELYAGMQALAGRHGVAIVGGDCVRAPVVTIALTLVGEAEQPLLRSTARAGDVVFATRPLGHAGAGLWCLEHPTAAVVPHTRAAAETAHRRPRPPVEAGLALAASGRRVALMDNSDGLATCACTLALASKVDLVLDLAALPPDPVLVDVSHVAGVAPDRWLLDGGEDQGLVGTCAAADWPALAARLAEAGTPAQAVGRVQPGRGEAWLVGKATPLRPGGFAHFAD